MNTHSCLPPYAPVPSHIVDSLRHWAETKPEQPAFYFLEDGEQQESYWTFGELDQRARGIAAKLEAMGLRGERALLLYPPGLDFVAAFYGCLYAGVIAVPAYPPRRNRNMLRIQTISDDARAKAALTVQ
jgi:acyl-CoA synthetase (AMP-forming)/AMP-acid ligase II